MKILFSSRNKIQPQQLWSGKLEELNLELPPPIQSSESVSLGLKLTKYFNIMYK